MHWEQLSSSRPRSAAIRSSSSRSALVGPFPEPKVSMTTPFTGGCKKARTCGDEGDQASCPFRAQGWSPPWAPKANPLRVSWAALEGRGQQHEGLDIGRKGRPCSLASSPRNLTETTEHAWEGGVGPQRPQGYSEHG